MGSTGRLPAGADEETRHGVRGEAAIVGIAEYAPERRATTPGKFTIEQWADLAALALDDAGLSAGDVDGIVCARIQESAMFVPSTIAEYCGFEVALAELVDLGGATTVGMVWRAAAAIELGVCDVVVGALPSGPLPPAPAGVPHDAFRPAFGASSELWGSPQAEFDIPYGNVAQNCGYAMIAQRYGAVHGYDPRALAKIAADQRTNATRNPAGRLPPPADHGRRRARQPDDRRSLAPAGDRDAVHRRRRLRGGARRPRPRRRATAPPASPVSASGSRTRPTATCPT